MDNHDEVTKCNFHVTSLGILGDPSRYVYFIGKTIKVEIEGSCIGTPKFIFLGGSLGDGIAQLDLVKGHYLRGLDA